MKLCIVFAKLTQQYDTNYLKIFLYKIYIYFTKALLLFTLPLGQQYNKKLLFLNRYIDRY